jgi:TrmH family RNA methyltransferase
MLKITSRDNQRLKFAGKVCDGRVKDAIFLEGLRLAEEVLRADLAISDVLFTENFRQTERGQIFLQKIESRIVNLAEVSEKIFNSLSDTKQPQGIIVIAAKPVTGKSVVENNLQAKNHRFPLVVLLHQINNPSNLGAILRTAEAVRIAGVILTENSADVFSPKSLRGAMGASLRLPIWTNADFFEVVRWAKENGLMPVCAEVSAEKSYLEIDWKMPRLLVFGSEAHGLSAKERKEVGESLVIPMENNVESLNLAVSCGVILFEANRQINKKGD